MRGAGVLGIVFFSIYLAVNLTTYLEIQAALRPDGYLALTWDNWIREEHLPWLHEEQIQILEEKLRRTGKLAGTESLPRAVDGQPDPREWAKAIVGKKGEQIKK